MTELNQYQQEIEKLLTLQEKRTSKQLYNLYVDTIKDLKKSLLLDYQNFENLSRSQRMDLTRAETLLEMLEKRSRTLSDELGVIIPDHLKKTGEMSYNALFYEYEQTSSGISFALLNENALETIIETPVAGFKLSDRLKGNVEALRQDIKNEMTRSFMHGDSYQKAAKRLSVVGQSSYARAMRIMRTESGRVSAVSRQRSQDEADKLGIEFEKVWVSVLDARTRHTHAMLDGQTRAPKEYFDHGGLKTLQPHMFGIASEDVNCRCTSISRLKSDKTALQRRDNETGEVVEYKNYQEWEKAKKEQGMVEEVIDVPELPKGIKWNETTQQFERGNVKTTAGVLEILEKAKARNGENFNAKADRFLSWLKKQIFIDENIAKNPDFSYTENAITLRAKELGIKYNQILKSNKQKSEKKIISLVGGGDLTDGSCSSLALAYIGNKHGYDVLDFRGGQSMDLFAFKRTIRQMRDFPGVQLKSVFSKNEINATSELLSGLTDKTKEYYLAVAEHAAVVKQIDGKWHYLELQTENENGWKQLTVQELQSRFAASKRRRIEKEVMLYDADELGNSSEFKTLLGYINTDISQQMKGKDGYAK